MLLNIKGKLKQPRQSRHGCGKVYRRNASLNWIYFDARCLISKVNEL